MNDGYMDGLINGWMDWWMDELWVHGWIDGWTDAGMNERGVGWADDVLDACWRSERMTHGTGAIAWHNLCSLFYNHRQKSVLLQAVLLHTQSCVQLFIYGLKRMHRLNIDLDYEYIKVLTWSWLHPIILPLIKNIGIQMSRFEYIEYMNTFIQVMFKSFPISQTV